MILEDSGCFWYLLIGKNIHRSLTSKSLPNSLVFGFRRVHIRSTENRQIPSTVQSPSTQGLDFEVVLKIRQHDAFVATSNVLGSVRGDFLCVIFFWCKKIWKQGLLLVVWYDAKFPIQSLGSMINWDHVIKLHQPDNSAKT